MEGFLAFLVMVVFPLIYLAVLIFRSKCEKCGGRIKVVEGASPDASEGNKRLHYYRYSVCKKCGDKKDLRVG